MSLSRYCLSAACHDAGRCLCRNSRGECAADLNNIVPGACGRCGNPVASWLPFYQDYRCTTCLASDQADLSAGKRPESWPP